MTQSKPTLLLIEDDLNFRETLTLEFEDRGYEVYVAASAAELEPVLGIPMRFAVLDLRLGSEYGLNLLQIILSHQTNCRVVVLTGYGTVATAVKAMQLGASNYLTKPVSSEALEKALWVDQSTAEVEVDSPMSLARHEREYIEFVLSQCSGNVTRAAQQLGIHRQSLQRKLRKFT